MSTSLLSVRTQPENQVLSKYNQYLDECFRKGVPAMSIDEFRQRAAIMDPKQRPCDNKGFSYSVGHCAPPIGNRENGHACPDCPLRRLV